LHTLDKLLEFVVRLVCMEEV